MYYHTPSLYNKHVTKDLFSYLSLIIHTTSVSHCHKQRLILTFPRTTITASIFKPFPLTNNLLHLQLFSFVPHDSQPLSCIHHSYQCHTQIYKFTHNFHLLLHCIKSPLSFHITVHTSAQKHSPPDPQFLLRTALSATTTFTPLSVLQDSLLSLLLPVTHHH